METENSLKVAEAASVLDLNIRMWLDHERVAKQKREQCSVGSFQWVCRNADANRYFSMAQALFMAGREMGVINYEQYPMFHLNGRKEA